MSLETKRMKLIGVIESATDNMFSYTMDEKIADAIIQSGLVEDDNVYEPIKVKYADTALYEFHCQKCDELLYYGCETRINVLKYCKSCGCKLKE